ncbi:MAG: PIN domain-containing protein [Chloroflexi bacterium]|nr:PIN domain-containing protein [Chloroflexota bacterium]
MVANLPKVVIDTNIVFEGLTQQGGAAGLVLDAWVSGLLAVCVSNALAYEYVDVLARKLSAARWQRLEPVLGRLLAQAEFVTIYYSWRPATPDPADEHLVDCAMNANAALVTFNVRDFRAAQQALGLRVITPAELLTELARGG